MHREYIAEILAGLRVKSGLSQSQLAARLGRSKRTIQSWESGISCPDMEELFDWFAAVGQSPVPYIKSFLYGDKGISNRTASDRRALLHKLIDDIISDKEVDALLWIITGNHGSSPYAYLQKVLADLQSDIGYRQSVAMLIENNYANCAIRGNLSDESAPQPDLDALNQAIKKGREAYLNGDKGYIV